MDFGSEFDDDFFEKPKEREGKIPSKYEAKVCLPLWYMEGKESEKEAATVLEALKHQADMYYFSKNYSKAVETYEQCLKTVPSSNNTWKREFMENLSRSCLHLEDADKALEWGLKLHESSCSPDQKAVSLNLLATVCHKLGKYQEELEALHCCIQAHKSCPEFWMRLGLCYAGLFKINLPGTSLKSIVREDPEPCCAFNSKSMCQSSGEEQESALPAACAIDSSSSSSTQSLDTCSRNESEKSSKCEMCTLGVQIVSSCFIHTRDLMDSNGSNLLGSERDEDMKEKISSCLNYMEVDQSFIDIVSTELGTDFLTGMHDKDNSKSEQSECVLDTPKEVKD